MASPVDIASIFKRKGQTPTPETQATPAPQRPNPVLSYFDPVAYNKSQGIEETAEQRNKNKAFASGRPATIFSQPESSNIKIKKPTLGSGS